MGTWGMQAFENDTARDWAFGLSDISDLSLIESTFDELEADKDGYVDSDVGANALAACEVVARLAGKAGEPDADIDEWIERVKVTPSGALITRAVKALDRVMGENSELAELWADSDSHDEWREAMRNLRHRLQS